MGQQRILVCGATGALGGHVTAKLAAAGAPLRVLLREGRDPAPFEAIGAEVVRGDLRDAGSLIAAVTGVSTVVTTANAIGRVLDGDRDLTIAGVDLRGNENLIAASEAAGVGRFVFVSVVDFLADARTPFTDAKLATEARLRRSPMREVIVQPEMFQESWFGPGTGFDWRHGAITIYGRGESRHRYVAEADVAEAVARLALADDPPSTVVLAGPEALSRVGAVRAFEAATSRSMRVRHVPRAMLRVGRVAARPFRPAVASVMGMALSTDVHDMQAADDAFRDLGIQPRPVSAYIAGLCQA